MIKLKFLKGIFAALRGIIYATKTEENLQIQFLIGLIPFILGLILNIPKLHLLILIIVSFLVIILELINTTVEKLVNKLSPGFDRDYGIIKDISAGVVLLGVILSIVVGAAILIFPMINFLNSLF